MMREKVAGQDYPDYLETLSRHHSIPVMDHEVDRFLARLPQGALVLDVGGCWGWHWRRLSATRPDVGVVILDYVRANLFHAQRVLGQLVGAQVALLHADATALPFPDASSASGFDGVWSVQVYQHIPDFSLACREAQRVLRPSGHFANYSLHVTPLNRLIYRLFRKPFHTRGMKNNMFYLTRANDEQRDIVAEVFGATVTDRYTECLFHPDLRIVFPGVFGSVLGGLDARLGRLPSVGRWIARQRSFEVTRPWKDGV